MVCVYELEGVGGGVLCVYVLGGGVRCVFWCFVFLRCCFGFVFLDLSS